MKKPTFSDHSNTYLENLESSIKAIDIKGVQTLTRALLEAWDDKNQIFICGNGGSAANAVHIANDLHYGVGCKINNKDMPGLRVEALTSNTAIITCLANDIGYAYIYSNQIKAKALPGDILIALSGSGNSENIVNAINEANKIGMNTFAILAYDGGKCKKLAKNVIHSSINDMQIAEDLQLVIGHLCMQSLNKTKRGEIELYG